MYLECMIVFKNYKPLQLEKGMFFINSSYVIRELTEIPRNQEEFIAQNGYPIELYVIDPGNPNEDDGYILANPEQIGWFDEGDHSDELSDITIKNINDIIDHYEGWIDVQMEETEEGDFVPVLHDDKIIIRMPQPYDDDDWDDDADDEPSDDQIFNNFNHEGGIKY